MSAFDYQQWRNASAVTPEMLDSCLARIVELEEELACARDGFWRREEECEALAERLNERDRMLDAVWAGHQRWHVPTADTKEEWLADLHTRAERGTK